MTDKKEKLIKPDRPGGFLDFLPTDYLAREKMLRKIEKVFRSFGFDPIETPRVEFLKTLAGEQSDTGKRIFLIDSAQDNEQLALPFDHTVPFARLLAANPYDAKKRKGIRLPWRRMAVGPVFRGERPQSGRYRQFYQFDADIAGTASMVADAEIIGMMYRTMITLGVHKFVIKINNRKILNGLAHLVGVKDRGKVKADDITKEMMRILDKIDKIGLSEVIKELKRKPKNQNDLAPSLADGIISKFKSYIEITGTNREKLEKCAELFKGVGIAEEGIAELREILEYLKIMKIPEEFVVVYFSIARGLDYYTGPVMETVLTDAPQFGSVFSGGRYNGLVSRFTGQKLPAVGTSIGVDRLFAALDSLSLIDRSKNTVTEAMVLRLMPGKDKEYIHIADSIRKCGLNTEINLLDDITFKSQFNFAISRGVKYVVICGEEEFEKNTIQIKNLETRKQEEISINNLEKYFS